MGLVSLSAVQPSLSGGFNHPFLERPTKSNYVFDVLVGGCVYVTWFHLFLTGRPCWFVGHLV